MTIEIVVFQLAHLLPSPFRSLPKSSPKLKEKGESKGEKCLIFFE
jgi:hypothetical protein